MLRQQRRKTVALLASLILLGVICLGAAFGSFQNTHLVALPSDTTNEARALLLLQEQGLITLKDGSDLQSTPKDIVNNPYHIQFVEQDSANIARCLDDVSFGVINGNYAVSSNIADEKILAQESENSKAAKTYANIIAVKQEDQASLKTQALMCALASEDVKTFIENKYHGSVIYLQTPQSHSDALSAIPQAPANNNILRVGASPVPHAEILEVIKPILEQKGWKLEIIEYSDYVQPNAALANGEIDANYFQHKPYLDDYNAKNHTQLVSAGAIHFEPLRIYAGREEKLK